MQMETDSICAKLFTRDHKQMSIILICFHHLYSHSDKTVIFYFDNDVSNIETSDNSNILLRCLHLVMHAFISSNNYKQFTSTLLWLPGVK